MKKKEEDLKKGGKKANKELQKEHAKKKSDLVKGGRKANKTLAKEHEDGVQSSEGKPMKMDPKKKKKMLEEMRKP